MFSLYIKNKETFNFIKNNKKKIECRLYRGKIKKLKKNDNILIINHPNKIYANIEKITIYPNFKKVFEYENLSLILPNINKINEAYEKYENYYKKKDIINHYIIAIQIKLC
jgi:ASC-1-like (ASCH) protein